MKKLLFCVGIIALATFHPHPASAEDMAPPHHNWPDQGIFGTYDRAALQRGFQVYKEVCSACHQLKYIYYRNLEALGYTPDQVKAIAAQYSVTDGPNDDGEMFQRPAKPSDPIKAPFPNEKAARAANGGAAPPDLSMIINAREHGEDYVFSILTGFRNPPADAQMVPGTYWNQYFPGNQIKMPPPLSANQVTFEDGTPATLEQEARDVVQFLSWASQPHMEERKRTGTKAILFLLAFAGILYAAKRKVWKDVA